MVYLNVVAAFVIPKPTKLSSRATRAARRLGGDRQKTTDDATHVPGDDDESNLHCGGLDTGNPRPCTVTMVPPSAGPESGIMLVSVAISLDFIRDAEVDWL